jgi:K+-transporting ATPase ATPase A chain
MVAIFQILAGEVIFGGVGAGMYGILLFVVLTVFLSGLMVGRSPEYLGKKIEKTEVKFALFGVLIPSVAILLGVSISSVTQAGLSARTNFGPHGFSEILYAFTSAGGNNGSAFAGLGVDSEYYNIMLGMTMLVGRFGVIFPFLAIAGSLAGKNIAPVSSGTFRTDSLLFFFLLTFVIIIIGALTFLPHLVLGPIVEHFLMKNGKLF